MRKRQISDPDAVARALAHRFARMGQIVGGGGISSYELSLCVRDCVGCDFETAGEAVLAGQPPDGAPSLLLAQPRADKKPWELRGGYRDAESDR